MYDNYTVPELIPILGDDAHVRNYTYDIIIVEDLQTIYNTDI